MAITADIKHMYIKRIISCKHICELTSSYIYQLINMILRIKN